MRRALFLVALLGCAGTRIPCVPGAGPDSYLAGSWHAPDPPSDVTIDMTLRGSADAVCGSATTVTPVQTTVFDVSGNEHELLLASPDGAVDYYVVQDDATHILLVLDKNNPTSGGYRFVRH